MSHARCFLSSSDISLKSPIASNSIATSCATVTVGPSLPPSMIFRSARSSVCIYVFIRSASTNGAGLIPTTEQNASKKRMARPVRKWFSTPWPNQSASTYPVSGSILPAKMEIRAFWS